MTKREFASMLAEELKKEGMDAEADHIFRADGTYEAVVIKAEPGLPCPRIPVDGLFEAYETGTDLDQIREAFVKQAREAASLLPADVMQVQDWTWAKKNMVLRLVPEGRDEYLAAHVCRPVADIHAVCCCLLNDEAAVTVTPSLMEGWGISEDQLYKAAGDNTVPTLPDLSELLGMGQTSPAMTVLTTSSGRFGAGAVLHEGVQEKLDTLYPEGFYLLPSSIHEWIAVGKDNAPDDLKRMVKDINRTVLCPQDILSDNVYTLEGGVLKVVC